MTRVRQAKGVKPTKRRSMPRRRLRTPNPEMRARIMESGAELIRDRGFPKLRIEEIAERAGVSVGSFYLYFEGKPDLFVALVQEHTETLRERMRAADSGTGSSAERLTRRLSAYLDHVAANERGFLYFRDGGTIDTNVGSLATWALNVHAGDLRPLLEAGMKAGEIRRMDAELLAQALVGTIQHLAGFWLEHRDVRAREEIEQFIGTFTTFGMVPRQR